MNKSCIIVDVNNFALNTDIFVVKDDGTVQSLKIKKDLDNLAQNMVDLAYANNIYCLRVCGSALSYSELRDCIEQYEKRQYSQNKIEVEIM